LRNGRVDLIDEAGSDEVSRLFAAMADMQRTLAECAVRLIILVRRALVCCATSTYYDLPKTGWRIALFMSLSPACCRISAAGL
jgi:hypothetical protein